jgi:hypothetical protein
MKRVKQCEHDPYLKCSSPTTNPNSIFEVRRAVTKIVTRGNGRYGTSGSVRQGVAVVSLDGPSPSKMIAVSPQTAIWKIAGSNHGWITCNPEAICGRAISLSDIKVECNTSPYIPLLVHHL